MLSLFTCINNKKAWLMLLLAAFSVPASAAKIETLLMPGKVIEGHAKVESECTSCHSRFSKDTQNKLCLDCHDHSAIREDIEKKQGYHGRSKQVRDISCGVCHTDHKGRNAKVILLDRELFNHDETDLKLEGAHARVPCQTCHKKGKLWREAPHICGECHEKQDVHKGDFGKKCGECHGANNWVDKKFDHGKTDFPLKGAHEKALCASCHPNKKLYDKTPTKCVECHRGEDVHRKRFGEKCETCHNSVKWNKVRYNHDKTKFKLKGAHSKARCYACHLPGKEDKKLPLKCNDCHRADDVHKGRNGDKCEKCHNSENWGKARFDHDKETDFKLLGAHKKTTCNACHAGGVKKDAKVRKCVECHQSDDVHKGDLGKKCDDCHRETGWSEKVRFDHDLTKFPLYGLHALATCESCHTKGQYTSTAAGCNDCHEKDDDHKGALGEACNDCHNANGWRLWKFNHNRQTDYKLTNKHRGLACNACHLRGPPSATPNDCATCHEYDDVHRGRFGRNCSRCHTTKDFKKAKIGS